MSLPNYPTTRKETYLAKIAGQDVELPDYPTTREEDYLDWIAKHGGGGGTSDYTDLENKPQINDVTLIGNKSLSDLGAVSEDEMIAELREAEVVEGKNKLNIHNAIIRNSGMTTSINTDGSVLVDGTVTSGQNFIIIDSPNLNGVAYNLQAEETYVISYGKTLINGVSLKAFYKTGGSWVSIDETNETPYLSFTTPASFDDLWIQIIAPGGTTISNQNIYPMICTLTDWEKSHTYEPYYVPVKDRISGNNPLATLVENCDDPSVHRNTWGGRYLGSSVTAEQFAQISAGTFHGLLVGDYWTIGGVDWVIADVDYWLHCGDTECTTHHLVIVPRTCLYESTMNDTATVTGGYTGSKMRTDNLDTAKTTINSAFGSSHILTYRSSLSSLTSGNYETQQAWTDASIEIMNEVAATGTERYHNQMQGTNFAHYQTIDKTQLALFRLNPVMLLGYYNNNRVAWWLRDVVDSTSFTNINHHGRASANNATTTLMYVRPYFGLIG